MPVALVHIRSLVDGARFGMGSSTKSWTSAAGASFVWQRLEPADGGDDLFGHQLQRTKGAGPDNRAVRDLPALLRAEKLQRRASSVGFDWDDAHKVVEKIAEEAKEVAEAASPAERQEEIGDLLFVVANLARHLKVDPESALRAANAKFTRRFHFIETALKVEGRTASGASLDEMEALWLKAKQRGL